MPSQGRGWSPRLAELDHVLQHRRQQVDRHEHVGVEALLRHRLLDEQRADTQQQTVLADQRGAAPLRMRRGSEQRFLEQVFPVAGEFAPRDQSRFERMARAAVADDDHAVADRQRRGRAAFERRRVAAFRAAAPGRSR